LDWWYSFPDFCFVRTEVKEETEKDIKKIVETSKLKLTRADLPSTWGGFGGAARFFRA